jgi:hypothetical protein
MDAFYDRVNALQSEIHQVCIGQTYPIIICALFTYACGLLTEDIGHEPPPEVVVTVALMEHLRETFTERAIHQGGPSRSSRES